MISKKGCGQNTVHSPGYAAIPSLTENRYKNQAYGCMPLYSLFSGERKKRSRFQFKLRTMFHRYHLYRVHSPL